MTADTDALAPDLRVRHVLVPLDGSEFALQAMPTARVLAERLDAELQSISVAGADDDALLGAQASRIVRASVAPCLVAPLAP